MLTGDQGPTKYVVARVLLHISRSSRHRFTFGLGSGPGQPSSGAG